MSASFQCEAIRQVNKRVRRRCKNKTRMRHPYCWIHTRKIQGVAVKDSDIAGKGLFAAKDFKGPRTSKLSTKKTEGEKIITMTGPIITKEEKDSKEQEDNDYIFDRKKGTGYLDMEDASKSSVGRYSNDCLEKDKKAKKCEINAHIKNENNVLTLYTTKPIKKGTEITWSYGDQYWNYEKDDSDSETETDEEKEVIEYDGSTTESDETDTDDDMYFKDGKKHDQREHYENRHGDDWKGYQGDEEKYGPPPPPRKLKGTTNSEEKYPDNPHPPGSFEYLSHNKEYSDAEYKAMIERWKVENINEHPFTSGGRLRGGDTNKFPVKSMEDIHNIISYEKDEKQIVRLLDTYEFDITDYNIVADAIVVGGRFVVEYILGFTLSQYEDEDKRDLVELSLQFNKHEVTFYLVRMLGLQVDGKQTDNLTKELSNFAEWERKLLKYKQKQRTKKPNGKDERYPPPPPPKTHRTANRVRGISTKRRRS